MEHVEQTGPKPEEGDCMNTSTPVLPVVANGFHGHGSHGLEGKDAVLIHSTQTALNSQFLNESVSRNSKEDVIQTIESKFQAERSTRDLEVRILEAIRTEGDRTRRDNFERDLARAERDRTDGKFLALEKLIAGLLPTPAP